MDSSFYRCLLSYPSVSSSSWDNPHARLATLPFQELGLACLFVLKPATSHVNLHSPYYSVSSSYPRPVALKVPGLLLSSTLGPLHQQAQESWYERRSFSSLNQDFSWHFGNFGILDINTMRTKMLLTRRELELLLGTTISGLSAGASQEQAAVFFRLTPMITFSFRKLGMCCLGTSSVYCRFRNWYKSLFFWSYNLDILTDCNKNL
jgi:hypothetical protein